MNSSDTAFPSGTINGRYNIGLTKREYIAIQTMAGLLTGLNVGISKMGANQVSIDAIAVTAAQAADALIAQLSKEPA